ncbi:MAG TPA: Ig-like domain-containing protein [Bacteroidales bacterium]|nr:Ig-like domain-containing protein [Bacteroidales bacterium]HPR56767.1 Ig-like domain-containing protein [Bacteroidales bacterium]
MKSRKVFLGFMAVLAMFAITLNSCEDDDPVELALTSLVSGDIDLNAATSPNNVSVTPTIVATFSTDVDPTSANANTITLTQDYDNANIPLTITVAGKTITLVPEQTLCNGALYKLMMTADIKSTEDKYLTAVSRNFTTVGTFVPAGAIAYWNFEDNADDQIGPWDPTASTIVDITYTDSRNAVAGKAATFNGTTSIIEIPNGDLLINTENFTLSFWVKTQSEGITHGHFVMGLGAYYGLQFEIFGAYDGAKFAISYELENGEGVSEDMWFPFDAQDASNGGWQGWDFAKSIPQQDMIALLKDNWLHVTYTYDGAAKKGTLYYNGEKMKSFDFNLWPEDDPKLTVTGMKYRGVAPEVLNEFALGFIQSRGGTLWDNEPWGGYDFPDANHFKGQLDDIRFFHKVLTPTEISLMYESEK